MSTGKAVLGVLAGVAFGATLGILFAPGKGSDTRKRIIKKGDDYFDNIGEKFTDFMETIAGKFEMAKDEASRLSEKAIAKKNELLSDVQDTNHAK